MSDEDEVAISGDMEPESATGVVETDDEDISEGEPEPSGQVARRGRVISETTRAAFAKAQASIKAQLSADKQASDFGEYDEGATTVPATGAPATTTPLTPPPAAPVAPIPQPDAAIEAQRQRLEMRQADLEAREQAVIQREKAADPEALRDAYFARGAAALVEQIKAWSGITSEDDLRDEIADLITELSGTVLGVQVDSNIKAKIDAKRATKGVRAEMAKLTRREQALTAQQQAQAEKAQRTQTERLLHEEIIKPETAKQFPYLAAEDTAGELVFDAVEAQYKRDGTMLPWTEAAKRVNDYLQTKWRAAYDRRAHLFAPATAGQGAPRERPQGDPQGIRRSHTLTNGAPAGTPPPPVDTETTNGRFNPEAHRARTKQKFRAAFVRTNDE